jgi:ABC-2 type transport system ATP-binding protein
MSGMASDGSVGSDRSDPSRESASTPDAAILVEDLRKRYGAVEALAGVSFRVEAGEIFGLLGPNGAGKTTAIGAIAGLVSPDGGTVRVASAPAGSIEARLRLGIAPQEIAVYEDLTARENLAFFGGLYGLHGRSLAERAAAALGLVGLAERARDRVSTYSGGMKRRLNLAAALVHDPSVLLLDEPTVGVDPQSRANLFDAIRALAERGKAVLYTTHYMEEAEKLCRRIAILDRGGVLAQGTLSELMATVRTPSRLRFRVPAGEAERAARALGPGAAERRAGEGGDPAILEVAGGGAEIPARLHALETAGVHASSVEMENATLETLFLELTGKRLRD